MKVLTVIITIIGALILAMCASAFIAWLVIGVVLPMFGVVVVLTFWQYVIIGLTFSLITSYFRTSIKINKKD